MAAKKSRGLGRGLDALFGDMEVDILKNDNEDTIPWPSDHQFIDCC